MVKPDAGKLISAYNLWSNFFKSYTFENQIQGAVLQCSYSTDAQEDNFVWHFSKRLCKRKNRYYLIQRKHKILACKKQQKLFSSVTFAGYTGAFRFGKISKSKSCVRCFVQNVENEDTAVSDNGSFCNYLKNLCFL